MAAFVSLLVNPITKIIDKVLPDKAANDAAKAALLSSEVQGEFSNALAQIQVNQAEAGSKSVFVAGWRPAIGWVCAAIFAYAYIVQPFLQFFLVAFHVNFDATKLPTLNVSEMMPVMLGMLGLGAMRSYDKANGNGNGH